MRIDAHHHFWKLGRYDYPWLGPHLNAIYRDFGPGDLQPLLARHHLDGTPGLVGVRHQVHDSQLLAQKQVTSHIYERAYRNRPLSDAHKESNRQKSRIHARIEHVFGYVSQSMTEFYLRSVGRRRHGAASGLVNRGDNRARYEQIVRLKLRSRTAT